MKVFLSLLVIGISVYEISNMSKRKQKKEMILFIVIATLTLLFGYFSMSVSQNENLMKYILKTFGQQF